MTELLPCPFCECDEQRETELKKSYKIQCVNAGCGAVIIGVNKTEAAFKWNTRADDWQPIDTAPKDGTLILIPPKTFYNGGHDTEISEYHDLVQWLDYNGLEAWRNYDLDIYYPTHWKPLPTPPQETDNG